MGSKPSKGKDKEKEAASKKKEVKFDLKEDDKNKLNKPYTKDFVLVENVDTLKESIETFISEAKQKSLLAVGYHGECVSRFGNLYILSLSTRSKAFLIDVLVMNRDAFECGLKGILEDEGITKLVFDGRDLADSLLYQFDVRLAGVLDLQLLEVIKHPPAVPTHRTFKRRSDKYYEVVKLKRLIDCVKVHLEESDPELVKSIWLPDELLSDLNGRPLDCFELEHVTACAMSLFHLYDNFAPDEQDKGRLVVASGIYADQKRSIKHRKFNEFEENKYLPMDVIPENGRTDFDTGEGLCSECHRSFPDAEFSLAQMKRFRRLCRTCKRVQQDITTRENRQRELDRIAGKYEDVDVSSDGSDVYGMHGRDYLGDFTSCYPESDTDFL